MIKACKTAVLWWKACSTAKPDYYVEYLPDNPWIHQPFEVYDTLRPSGLRAICPRPEAESAAGDGIDGSVHDPDRANEPAGHVRGLGCGRGRFGHLDLLHGFAVSTV